MTSPGYGLISKFFHVNANGEHLLLTLKKKKKNSKTRVSECTEITILRCLRTMLRPQS